MKSKILGLIFFALFTYVPQNCSSSSSFFESLDDRFEEEARLATVLVAKEINYFESAFGADPYTIWKPFRYFYEWLFPSDFAHGTGFLITSDGYIITNEHVVNGATTLVVVMQNPEFRICKARLVGSDERTDVAVLKLEDVDDVQFPYLKWGNSLTAKVGDAVIAIGNPVTVKLESTLTKGIISAKERIDCGMHDIDGYIQTDASINGGNSGGPLLNSRGEVIGMNTWIYSHYSGHEGLGFAVPSDTVKLISDQLIKKGKISQGFLGVELDNTKEAIFDTYFINNNDGAYVVDVIKDSPAKNAGIEEGDLILKLNDCEITTAHGLRNQVWIRTPNSPIKLVIERDGEIIELSMKLGSEDMSNQYSISTSWKLVI